MIASPVGIHGSESHQYIAATLVFVYLLSQCDGVNVQQLNTIRFEFNGHIQAIHVSWIKSSKQLKYDLKKKYLKTYNLYLILALLTCKQSVRYFNQSLERTGYYFPIQFATKSFRVAGVTVHCGILLDSTVTVTSGC